MLGGGTFSSRSSQGEILQSTSEMTASASSRCQALSRLPLVQPIISLKFAVGKVWNFTKIPLHHRLQSQAALKVFHFPIANRTFPNWKLFLRFIFMIKLFRPSLTRRRSRNWNYVDSFYAFHSLNFVHVSKNGAPTKNLRICNEIFGFSSRSSAPVLWARPPFVLITVHISLLISPNIHKFL